MTYRKGSILEKKADHLFEYTDKGLARRWIIFGLIISVIVHLSLFLYFRKIPWSDPYPVKEALETTYIQLKTNTSITKQIEPLKNITEKARQEDVIKPKEILKKLEEHKLKESNQNTKLQPSIAETNEALETLKPSLQAGSIESIAKEAMQGYEVENDLADAGNHSIEIPTVDSSDYKINPGDLVQSEIDNQSKQISIEQKGAGGMVPIGSIDGIKSIEELIGLPQDALVKEKTALPGDVLFEYNRADLQGNAGAALLKLGLLMDLNPELVCWIDGHSDLFGDLNYNISLSLRRAEAVKNYLVREMKMDASRIFTRGLGSTYPLVQSGNIDQQSVNRRVEISMRPEPPPPMPLPSSPSSVQGSQPIIEPVQRAVPIDDFEKKDVPSAVIIPE